MEAIEVKCRTFFNEEIKSLDVGSMRVYDEIMKAVSKVEASEFDATSLWLTAQRGSYDEYKKHGGRGRSIKSKRDFLKFFPNETIWFRFGVVENENVKFLSLDGWNFMLSADSKGDDRCGEDCTELLEWIRERVEEAIQELKEGTYNEKVARELPYQYRIGTIARKPYWDAFPDRRENAYEGVSAEERKRFLELVSQEGKENIPENCIKEMTFAKYFEMVFPCYMAMEKESLGTVQETFFRFAEDFGGRVLESEIDYNSVKDFDLFYDGAFGFCGGHPWGIWRGSSRVRIMLYPERTENGYYFKFAGNPNWNIRGIIKCYLALKDTGAPIVFPYPKDTIKYMKEEDVVGIVPCDSLPVYCQLMFPNQKVNDFRHYDEGRDKKIFDLIRWQPIAEVKLRQ